MLLVYLGVCPIVALHVLKVRSQVVDASKVISVLVQYTLVVSYIIGNESVLTLNNII